MRIDVVSIFPAYLAPLELSLLGRARDAGLVDLHTHDLRHWTHDRHRTVDDTPYGGGAGMVMKPEPWGEALDDLLGQQDTTLAHSTRLVVLTPSGKRFTQATATRLSAEDRLIFACGRYEGIDQRVIDHYAGRIPVDEVSIGDFVLNGGEVAAMVVIEAVVRLLPGVLGNPASLAEESHHTDDGLLEYPVYTQPQNWRGLDVPDVLMSGHHAHIAQWRHEQSLRRTAARRPDLLHPSATVSAADAVGGDLDVRLAQPGDAAELLTLQRCCWVGEAQLNDALFLPALVETLADVRAGLDAWSTWVVRSAGRLVASVRAGRRGQDWEIGRLMVAPDVQGRGLGKWLLEYAEQAAPDDVHRLALFTGAASAANLRMYARAGYRRTGEPFIGPDGAADPGVVRMAKSRQP